MFSDYGKSHGEKLRNVFRVYIPLYRTLREHRNQKRLLLLLLLLIIIIINFSFYSTVLFALSLRSWQKYVKSCVHELHLAPKTVREMDGQ